MPRTKTKVREQAFYMRLDRKSFTEISKELGVSTKTIARWENGYKDRAGHLHTGWKQRLEEKWKEVVESDLQYGLMLKKERLAAMEKAARMIISRVNALIPSVKIKNASDIKALLSEARELLKLIASELGENMKGPNTVVAVKTDITLNELQDRYAASQARRSTFKELQEGKVDDGSDIEKDA